MSCSFAVTCGFISDWRRINVAITRAQFLLIVIGSYSTIRYSKWGRWAEQAEIYHDDRYRNDPVKPQPQSDDEDTDRLAAEALNVCFNFVYLYNILV